MTKQYLLLRNNVFHFRITVPKHLRSRFGKQEFRKSLQTRNKADAIIRCGPLLDYYLNLFQLGEADDRASTFQQARDTAAKLAIEYCSAEDVGAASIEDAVMLLVPRLATIDRIKKPTRAMIDAIGGTVLPPDLTMQRTFERFLELSPGKFHNLNSRDRDKKLTRYRRAATVFTEEMGDVDLLKLTTKDVHEFVLKLVKRVENGSFHATTAIRTLQYVSMYVRKVFEVDFPDRQSPFAGKQIEDIKVRRGRRLPFTEAEIEALNMLLEASGASEELKAICALMEFTGAHAKEICLLTEEDIHLEAPVPYISIRPNIHRDHLKTEGARIRDIPLVGGALKAAKQFPKGFPRYCRANGSEALSAAANALIAKIAPGKTTYSYRHRMADVLRNNPNVKDDLMKSIMGHNGGMSAEYGKGFYIPIKLEAINTSIQNAKQTHTPGS